MIKRFLVIPIMLIYMLAVSGVFIHAHYCGDELESWDVYEQSQGCAGGECGDETEQSDDCCKDKVITAKVSIDQKVSDSYKFFNAQDAVADLPALPEYAAYNSYLPGSATRSNINQANAPPGLWQGIPLYKLHTSFTYYG